MTRDESKYLIRVIKSLFPNWKIDGNPSDTVDAWHYVLREQPLNICMSALKAYTLSNLTGFPPSPGQLLGQVTKTDEIPESDAWSMVKRAISRSGYSAQEEWTKLPGQVRDMVTPALLHSWALTEDLDITILAGQFHRYYVAAQIRRAEAAVIPEVTMATLMSALESSDKPMLPAPDEPEPEEPPKEIERQEAPMSMAELIEKKRKEMMQRRAQNGVEESPVQAAGE